MQFGIDILWSHIRLVPFLITLNSLGVFFSDHFCLFFISNFWHSSGCHFYKNKQYLLSRKQNGGQRFRAFGVRNLRWYVFWTFVVATSNFFAVLILRRSRLFALANRLALHVFRGNTLIRIVFAPFCCSSIVKFSKINYNLTVGLLFHVVWAISARAGSFFWLLGASVVLLQAMEFHCSCCFIKSFSGLQFLNCVPSCSRLRTSLLVMGTSYWRHHTGLHPPRALASSMWI